MKTRKNTSSSSAKAVSTTNKVENKKNKILVYKTTSLKTINKEVNKARRSTRQIEHVYDLDVSNDPALPFKKTRAGFKLKTTLAKQRLEAQKNKKLKKNKTTKKMLQLATTKPNNIQINQSNELHDEADHQFLEDNNHSDDLLEDEVDDPANDLSHSGNSLNILPDNSTPIFALSSNRSTDLKISLYKDFISPITRSSRADCSQSPWRMNTFENKRLPANFPVKTSLLPTYDKDTSLRYSTLEYSSPIILRPTSPTPARLFEDDMASNEVHASEENTNTSIQDISESSNSGNNLDACNENEAESFILQDNMNENKIEKSSNLFEFQSILQTPIKVLRARNENVSKPTRISLREIKNVINNCKKPSSTSNKENVKKHSPKKITCTATCPIVQESEINENTMNHTNELQNQSTLDNTENKIFLFDDPEELYPILTRDESFQCYQPKAQKRKKPVFQRKHDKVDKPKRIKTKDKLTTEEWVAAKKWERSFNTMVEEVESFEMIIE